MLGACAALKLYNKDEKEAGWEQGVGMEGVEAGVG